MAEKITVVIDLDSKTAQTSFKRLEDQAEKTGKEISKGLDAGKSFDLLKKGAFGAAGAIAAVGAAFAAAVKSSIPAISSYEKIENQLKLLTGSTGAAQKTLEDLSKFAATTPFQFEDIAQATNKLLSFGIENEVVIDRVKSLGEVAAGTNSNLGELALIFGQVRAAGKLTGERLLQLQERAVPIGPALAKTFGIAEESVRDLVSSGKVGFKDFEKAFLSLSQQGGQFQGALKAQSETVGGILSTLSDNFFQLQVQFVKTFGPALIESANTIIGIIQGFSADIAANGPTLVSTFKQLADIFVTTPSKFWANFFGVGDAGTSRQKVLADLLETQFRIKEIKAELEKNKDSTIFNSIFGRKGQLEDELKDLTVKLLDLETLKARFDAKFLAETGTEDEDAKKTADKIRTSLGLPTDEERMKIEQELTEIGTFIADAQLSIQGKTAAIGASFETTAKTTLKASKAIANAVKNALVNSISSSFQTFANNLVAGKNLFEGFGKSILGILGDLAISIGKTAVAAGITIESLFGLKGAAAAAAGVALIAIGSVLKAVAGGGGALGGAGGGGGGTSGAPVATDQFGSELPTFGEDDVERGPNTVVNVNFDGVIDTEDGARRVADLLNQGFEAEGIVLKGAL